MQDFGIPENFYHAIYENIISIKYLKDLQNEFFKDKKFPNETSAKKILYNQLKH